MSKGTARRSVRIDGPLWDRAKEVAAKRGDNLSDIIRAELEGYVAGNADALTAILERSQNATTIHARLALRDEIQEISERWRS